MCGDTIYSRANYDFRDCSCGQCFVDGGPIIISESDVDKNYFRVGWTIKEKTIDVVETIEIPAQVDAKKYLWEDYNWEKDEYGLIKDPKYTEDDVIAAKAQLKLLEDT